MHGGKREGEVRKEETSAVEGGERGAGRGARARAGLECGQAPQEFAPLGAAGILLYCLLGLEPRTAVTGKLATPICPLATEKPVLPLSMTDKGGGGSK